MRRFILLVALVAAGVANSRELEAQACGEYSEFSTYTHGSGVVTPLQWSYRICNAGEVSGEQQWQFIFRFRNTASRRMELTYSVYLQEPQSCGQQSGSVTVGSWAALPAGATVGGEASGNVFWVPKRRYGTRLWFCVTQMSHGPLGGPMDHVIGGSGNAGTGSGGGTTDAEAVRRTEVAREAEAARQAEEARQAEARRMAALEAERQRVESERRAEAARQAEAARAAQASQQAAYDRRRAELEAEKEKIMREYEANRARSAATTSAIDSLTALGIRFLDERDRRRKEEAAKRRLDSIERELDAVERNRARESSAALPGAPSINEPRISAEHVVTSFQPLPRSNLAFKRFKGPAADMVLGLLAQVPDYALPCKDCAGPWLAPALMEKHFGAPSCPRDEVILYTLQRAERAASNTENREMDWKEYEADFLTDLRVQLEAAATEKRLISCRYNGFMLPGESAPRPARPAPASDAADATSAKSGEALKNLVQLAYTHHMARRFEEELAAAKAVLDLNPNDPSGHKFAGDAYEGLGKLAEARHHFGLANRLAPADGWIAQRYRALVTRLGPEVRTLSKLSGEGMAIPLGEWREFAVKVVDAAGAPVAGAKVAWQAPSFGSQVYVGMTDANGVSTATNMFTMKSATSAEYVQTATLAAPETPTGFTEADKVRLVGEAVGFSFTFRSPRHSSLHPFRADHQGPTFALGR